MKKINSGLFSISQAAAQRKRPPARAASRSKRDATDLPLNAPLRLGPKRLAGHRQSDRDCQTRRPDGQPHGMPPMSAHERSIGKVGSAVSRALAALDGRLLKPVDVAARLAAVNAVRRVIGCPGDGGDELGLALASGASAAVSAFRPERRLVHAVHRRPVIERKDWLVRRMTYRPRNQFLPVICAGAGRRSVWVTGARLPHSGPEQRPSRFLRRQVFRSRGIQRFSHRPRCDRVLGPSQHSA